MTSTPDNRATRASAPRVAIEAAETTRERPPMGVTLDSLAAKLDAIVAALAAANLAPRSGEALPPSLHPACSDPDPPRWISSSEAARVLRRRKAVVLGAAPAALRAGVARRTGTGNRRGHIRWDERRILQWWRETMR